jgi:hypothetical protein
MACPLTAYPPPARSASNPLARGGQWCGALLGNSPVRSQGVEPRAVQNEDVVLASGSLKVTYSNRFVTLFSDTSTVNVIVAAENAMNVDPASNANCYNRPLLALRAR